MNYNSKNDLRKEMLEKRKLLKNEEVDISSDKIIDTLLKIPAVKLAKNIMLYLSFKNEVNTFKLIDILNNEQKNVIVPYCVEDEKNIIPSILSNLNHDLVENNFGLLEPKKDKIKEIPIEEIDIIIVPGVVFDKKGNRIGFGAGYYDRFLKNKKNKTVTIGLCYDFQILDLIPTDEYDIPLEYIVTEKRVIVR